MDALATLSPSKLGTFTHCGRQYRFQYVDKLANPDTRHTVLGNIVHRALETFFDGDMRNEGLLKLALVNAELEHEEALTGLGESAIGIMTEADWIAKQVFQICDPKDVPVVSTEYRIHERFGDYELRGVIDRVDRNEDGTVTLVDYKTGKIPAKRDERDRLRALMLYALLWERDRGDEVSQVQLMYLRGTPKRKKPVIITATVTPQKMRFAADRMDAIGNAIVAAVKADRFGVQTGPLCHWCPYYERCPEGYEYRRTHPIRSMG